MLAKTDYMIPELDPANFAEAAPNQARNRILWSIALGAIGGGVGYFASRNQSDRARLGWAASGAASGVILAQLAGRLGS